MYWLYSSHVDFLRSHSHQKLVYIGKAMIYSYTVYYTLESNDLSFEYHKRTQYILRLCETRSARASRIVRSHRYSVVWHFEAINDLRLYTTVVSTIHTFALEIVCIKFFFSSYAQTRIEYHRHFYCCQQYITLERWCPSNKLYEYRVLAGKQFDQIMSGTNENTGKNDLEESTEKDADELTFTLADILQQQKEMEEVCLVYIILIRILCDILILWFLFLLLLSYLCFWINRMLPQCSVARMPVAVRTIRYVSVFV